MKRIPEYLRRIAGWELTTTAVGANAGELAGLLGKKDRLEVIAGKIKELFAEHALLRRSKQETMLELKALFREGETLVHSMRTDIRTHFGLGSEKLVEFGLQPNRPRSVKAPVPLGPEAPAPAEAEAAAATNSPSDSESSQ